MTSTARNATLNVTPTATPSPAITKPSRTRYAVAIFIGSKFYLKEGAEEDDDHVFYVGARTLVYQLLHAKRTKFSSPVSVVVLVNKAVRESKRQRLRDDVNKNATLPLDPNLPPIPNSYVLASTPDIAYRPFGFPPNLAAEDKRDYFSAGVIVLSPSTELYKL
ncbi:glycosyl transferase family 8 protein [Penicillium lagena]|uniref:glycosyl transferase family 8 protein n=1 Tax=Penicillium lagena TaxID=94218 RepID=UPI002540FB44|nr:glycosyl transferase family 8 protein [Penicillium lagena]KAJ5606012.1 glycosyl transferase family 8 protein [Penicillium lagena]